ncbi:MAG: glycosyltransferase family 2 protein [Dehalococcoidia bacterium]|nr:glycosyltransferase family 2 protein [Dehalococcoidia bacterium]
MTDDPSPAVAVIVVNYNSASFIDAFCASLADVEYGRLRLIVVDAASSDGSMDAIERAFPGATHVRCDENVGFAAGANIGVRLALAAGDDFALFLNNDVTLTPGFLRALVAAADPRTAVVPKILYAADPRLISTHAGGFDWRLGVFRDTFAGRADSAATSRRRDGIATASFCCALVPLAAFRESGLLDERFFMYYEETDFIRRAQAHGFRLRYEPSAVIYHRESGSSGGGWMTPFKQYYATRNRLYLVRKHATSRQALAYFTAYFWVTRVASAASMAGRGRWRLLRAMTLGMLDYYRGRMGRTREVRDL